MRASSDVPEAILVKLRSLCVELPEAAEEAAWVGTRWVVRKRTFAHVLVVAEGWPPAYARAVGSDGPLVLLMFRSSGEELDVLRNADHPFFAPVWRSDEVGMVLDADVDWEHVAELVTESYRAQAPKKLAALVDPDLRPPPASSPSRLVNRNDP